MSFEQFKNDYRDTLDYMASDDEIRIIYDNIKLPTRATSGSAGYDFCSPVSRTIFPQRTLKIPTGIRVKMDDGWVLKLYPRSGAGFKYRVQLNNTVGIVDQDYYYSDNEGHIFVKLINDNYEDNEFEFNAGDGIVQGIFVQYGVTIDDECETIRNGGFGSTDKNKKD